MADEAASEPVVPEASIEVVETSETPVTEPTTEVTETPSGEVQATVAETSAPQFDLRTYLREKANLDLTSKYQSDEDAAKGIANALGLVGRKSEKERQFDAIAPYLPQFQQFLAAQQQPTQQQYRQEAEQPAKNGFDPPKVRETDKRWIEKNAETGETQIRANAPLDVRQRLESYAAYVEDYNYKLQHAPHELWREVEERATATAEDRAVQKMLAFLQQRDQEQAERQSVERITSQISDKLYVRNTAGQPLTDESGIRVLTPWGQKYAEMEARLWNKGNTSFSTEERHAMALEYADLATSGHAAPALPPGGAKAKTVTGGKVNDRQATTPTGSFVDMVKAQNPNVDWNAPATLTIT